MKYGTGCSGIGGIDYGLDLAGWRCAFQIENAPFPRRVLRKHWPRVMLFSDVYHCGLQNLPRVNLFAFGFPCLDLSASAYGSHAGLDGSTSGPVFYQCARIACELRPEWLLIENVPSVKKHMAKIAAALPHWNLEYADLTASDFGAYTRRVRTFIVDILETDVPARYWIRPQSLARLFKAEGPKMFSRCACPGKAGYPWNALAAASLSIRKLTPLEYERAMGFPDGWTALDT